MAATWKKILIESDVIDEDDMVSDLATKVPTQQSVKAYVLANAGGLSLYWQILNGETVTVGARLEYLIGSGVLSMAGTMSLGAGTNLCVINGGT